MRKLIIFALLLTLALGGIGFAHAAVTAGQDDLVIFPCLEVGNRAALDGLSASVTFGCGDHLRWNSTYRFDGGTETDFVYTAEAIAQEPWQFENRMDFWLSSGMSASADSFTWGSSGYAELFRAVADETPIGESRNMSLQMADYAEHYALDFELSYREYDRQCIYSVSFADVLAGSDWYSDDGVYNSFLNRFRFPVQPEQTVSLTVSKDNTGRINSFELYLKDAPDLSFVSHVDGAGIWFVPIFRDEQGAPLPYESPEGHGIYFVPWKVLYTYDTEVRVVPDLGKLRRVIPLEEDLLIDQIRMDGDTGEGRILSREGAHYVLTIWDLSTGRQKSRMEVLPYDAARADFGSFTEDNGLLLVTAQGQLALVDPGQDRVLLTAPDVAGQHYSAASHRPELGDLRFDGQQLYLLNPGSGYGNDAFWTAVWQEGALLYYGEYDCSLMRGNHSWYYASVTADCSPLLWN